MVDCRLMGESLRSDSAALKRADHKRAKEFIPEETEWPFPAIVGSDSVNSTASEHNRITRCRIPALTAADTRLMIEIRRAPNPCNYFRLLQHSRTFGHPSWAIRNKRCDALFALRV